MKKGEKLYFGLVQHDEYTKKVIDDIMKIEDFVTNLNNDFVEMNLSSQLMVLKLAAIGAALAGVSDEDFDKILNEEDKK